MFSVVSELEFIRKNMEDNVFDMTVAGECCGCGSCCSNLLPMNSKEIKVIRNYMRKNCIQECKRNIPVVKRPYDMTCPFLDTGKNKDKCRIYEVRPLICKLFICNNEQRAKFNREHVRSTRCIVDVREKFFRDK